MKHKRGFKRTDRVAQQLLEIISRVLLTEAQDPRVHAVQVTHVDVSPDLKHARIFYVVMQDDADRQKVQEALESSAGFVKREIGQRASLKYIPELVFAYDESVDRGRRIDELLSGLSDHKD